MQTRRPVDYRKHSGLDSDGCRRAVQGSGSEPSCCWRPYTIRALRAADAFSKAVDMTTLLHGDSRGRILLADDEETFRLSTADLLQREGFQCDAVLDGGEALARVRTEHYDLLVSDIKMKGKRTC